MEAAERLPPTLALVNGTLAQTLDFDDGGERDSHGPFLTRAPGRVGSTARARMGPGDALLAYILGVGVNAKLPARFHCASRSRLAFHSRVGRVRRRHGVKPAGLGLSRRKFAPPSGIAASMTGGPRADFGTMTKPLHAGLAARNGIMAARMAQAGWSAHQNILETEKGFFDVFACGSSGRAESRQAVSLRITGSFLETLSFLFGNSPLHRSDVGPEAGT